MGWLNLPFPLRMQASARKLSMLYGERLGCRDIPAQGLTPPLLPKQGVSPLDPFDAGAIPWETLHNAGGKCRTQASLCAEKTKEMQDYACQLAPSLRIIDKVFSILMAPPGKLEPARNMSVRSLKGDNFIWLTMHSACWTN